jgi:hypothetical protein
MSFSKNPKGTQRSLLLDDEEVLGPPPAAQAAGRQRAAGSLKRARAPARAAPGRSRGKRAQRGPREAGGSGDEEGEGEEEGGGAAAEVAEEEAEELEAREDEPEERHADAEVQMQRAAEAGSRAAVAQVASFGAAQGLRSGRRAHAPPPPPPPPPQQQQQPELAGPLLLPDGSLLLPDGRRILPDGSTLPGPPPLPVAEDDLELAFQREQQALEEECALEAAFQAELAAAAWEAYHQREAEQAGGEVYTPGEPLPLPARSTRVPYNPEEDALPPSFARLEGAEEARLLALLYPRFRCKISGARSDTQAALLATLTAAKAAAEGVLGAEGKPPPHTAEQLRDAYPRCPAEGIRRQCGMGGVVEGPSGGLARAWALQACAWERE